MKKSFKTDLFVGLGLVVAFGMWTAVVMLVDLRPIGPQGSTVGLAGINGAVHRLIGVNMTLYAITDWLSLLPLGIAAAFGAMGLTQLITRKSLWQVDYSLLVLGGFYIVVMSAFFLFELAEINYRPVLINGCLETSYPSSTTLLVACIMPTAATELNRRIKSPSIRGWTCTICIAFWAFMVVGRILSGVHWFSDIIGAILLSGGLVMVYRGIVGLKA